MTLRHLKIFVMVADLSGMRKAAETLGISQPAVTQAIQEIEAEYHVKLFERISQKIFLTSMGERLLPYARQAVDLFEEINLIMRNNSEENMSKIGASTAVGIFMLNEMIDDYEEQFGPLEAEVVINSTMTIMEMLQSCLLDFAVVEGEIQSKDMIKHFICKDELVLVVGKDHPFFDRKLITLSELENETIIYRDDSPGISVNPYISLIEKKKINIQRTWRTNSTDAIKMALVHNRGIAILSNMVLSEKIDRQQARIIHVEGTKVFRDIYLVYHKDKRMSDTLINFIKLCNQKR